jgi:Domain of unknown function (DUF4352)
MRLKLAGAVVVALLPLALAAPASAKATTTTKPKTTTTKPAPKQPWIGSTLMVENQNKQYEAVTLQAVVDPATPDNSFDAPPAGQRVISVQIQIKNTSKGTDTDDANNNLTIIGANKQSYEAGFATINGCTNFEHGQYTLTQGQTEVGCVTFDVPTTVAIGKIRWNPNSGFSTNNAYWTPPPAG